MARWYRFNTRPEPSLSDSGEAKAELDRQVDLFHGLRLQSAQALGKPLSVNRPDLIEEHDRIHFEAALGGFDEDLGGIERLAELLIEISAGNAAAKRHLRMELAGAQSRTKLATPTTRNKGTSAIDEPHPQTV